MGSKFKKFLILLFLLILVSGSFSLGFYYGDLQCKVCPPEALDFSLFWDAYHRIQERFVDKGKLDTQKLIYGAISGMVQALGDPYTVFFPPQESKRFIEDVKGTFEGVGMEIDIKQNQLMVITPLEGTPAQRAGLRAGDKILKIGDTLTSDLTVEQAIDLIRGPKGSEVVLTVLREGWEAPREIKIIRGVIEVPSLKMEMKDSSRGPIAYLKIYQFSENLPYDFREAAIRILSTQTQRIIVDLRNNPGGYLEVAQDVTGWFIERGKIAVIEDFGNGKKEEYKTQGNGAFADYKVVVLINRGSASASEILAGALRDNQGILLIGEKSFGKGSVQELERLKDGSSLKITVAKWLTPKGNLITDIGLEPDLKVEITDQDIESGRDPQLDKAIEIIKNL